MKENKKIEGLVPENPVQFTGLASLATRSIDFGERGQFWDKSEQNLARFNRPVRSDFKNNGKNFIIIKIKFYSYIKFVSLF